MRVLHLRASNFYGGPERQLHLHAREALGSDCDVRVGSFTEGGRVPEYLQTIAADGITTHAFEVNSAYDPRAVRLVRGYLRDHQIDLLCTHEYRSSCIAWLAVRGVRTRWLAFSRGFTKENLKVRAYNWIDRLVTHGASHVVAVSQAQKRQVQRVGIPGDRISVVPNAVEPSLLMRGEPVDLRARFGFAPGDFVCVSGGRFSEEKGQRFLVDGALQAIGSVDRLRVVLFGDGPDREGLVRRIRLEGAGDRILCPGFEKNMTACLRGADLLVNPSLSEGMPNIVLEAMGVGVPVLATSVGGVPEIIEDGRTGWLVDPADPEAIAEGLVESASHPERGREMAVRALEFAREELGFARQFERMREAYVRGMGSHG